MAIRLLAEGKTYCDTICHGHTRRTEYFLFSSGACITSRILLMVRPSQQVFRQTMPNLWKICTYICYTYFLYLAIFTYVIASNRNTYLHLFKYKTQRHGRVAPQTGGAQYPITFIIIYNGTRKHITIVEDATPPQLSKTIPNRHLLRLQFQLETHLYLSPTSTRSTIHSPSFTSCFYVYQANSVARLRRKLWFVAALPAIWHTSLSLLTLESLFPQVPYVPAFA